MSDIVIGILAGSIVALISFVLGLFGNVWYAKYQDKKRRQTDGLKNHFIVLETNVIRNIISSLENTYNNQGYIYVTIQTDEEEQRSTDIRQPFSYWPMHELESGKFLEFQFHFPSQAHKIIELKSSAYKHNENIDSFDKDLESLIGEKAIYTWGIFSAAPRIIRYILNEIVKAQSQEIEEINKIKNRLKFKVHQSTYSGIGTCWEVNTTMGLYARTVNEEEAISINNKVSELIQSPSLLEQMRKIFMETDKIVNDAKDNVSNLYFIIDRYSKYGNLLKKREDCPTCELIFEEQTP